MKITISRILYAFLLSTFLIGCLTSCYDDKLYDDRVLGEGMCKISGTVDFKQFRNNDMTTRTAGNIYDGIRNLRIFVFNQSGEKIKSERVVFSQSNNTDGAIVATGSGGTTIKGAEFEMTLPFGKYKIYAVANMPDNWTGEDVTSIEELKSVELTWSEVNGTLGNNDEMLGVFKIDSSDDSVETDPDLIIVNKKNISISANLVRAVSKVTVAYDGSKLKEGVKIYIKSVTIKDLAKTCYLGDPNTINKKADLIPVGESVVYASETVPYNDNYPTLLTNVEGKKFYPRAGDETALDEDGNPEDWSDNGPHAHTSGQSLFFYENLQGTGDDRNKEPETGEDGTVTEIFKSGKEFGTYIEVEAFYESVNPEKPGIGDVKYRFLLGNNTTDNYNASRNTHYQLTLVFNGFAITPPDWELHKENFLSTTPVKVFDYRGEVFFPDESVLNLGRNFSKDNVVEVNSYMETTKEEDGSVTTSPVAFTIKYRPEGASQYSENSKPDWLTMERETGGVVANAKIKEKVTFRASKREPETIDINDRLGKNTTVSNYNLANPGGSGIQNAANCYIVSAKGTYTLPCVYGNAIIGGNEVENSYKTALPAGTTRADQEEDYLYNFVNYLGNPISSAYIKDDDLNEYNEDGTVKATHNPASATLVWQDEVGLLSVSDIKYDANFYNGKGGISFTVAGAVQGNAVIELRDENNTTMWSWHIWMTDLTALGDEKDMTISGSGDYGEFSLLSVPLGWCSGWMSAEGKKWVSLKWYKPRYCDVKFEAGKLSVEIRIYQESHLSLPIGNTTYYQWGRKDPFPGGYGVINYGDGETSWNDNFLNKPTYNAVGSSYYVDSSIPLLTEDNDDDQNKLTTREALAAMIANPGKWHNSPRTADQNGNMVVSDKNKGYYNLWGGKRKGISINSWNELPALLPVKTVYDPSPVGYQMCPANTFRGLTYNGDVAGLTWNMSETDKDYNKYCYSDTKAYDVLTDNMDGGDVNDNVDVYRHGIYEFYTDRSKTKSVCFLETGYRDWAAKAQLYWNVQYGYIWTARNGDDNSSLNFEYSRLGSSDNGNKSFVRPVNNFYYTDGMMALPYKVGSYNQTPQIKNRTQVPQSSSN